MNIPITLDYLRPGEEWVLDGEDYKGLTWISETKKPTKKEIEDAYPLALAAIEAAEAEKVAAREAAIAKLSKLGLDESDITALLGA